MDVDRIVVGIVAVVVAIAFITARSWLFRAARGRDDRASRLPGRRTSDMTVVGKTAVAVQLLALVVIIVLRAVDGESGWWWLGAGVITVVCAVVGITSERRRLRRLGLSLRPTPKELRAEADRAAAGDEVLTGREQGAGREQRDP